MKTKTYHAILILLLSLASVTAPAQEIGLQLYSLHAQFAKDVPGTMAKVKSWGITKVELAGTYGLSVEAFKKLLSQNGLTIVSTAAPFNKLDSVPQSIANDAKIYGAEYVVCHWIPHTDTIFTIEDAKKAVRVFNAAGKVLKENGLSFCYHPHGFEFRPYEGGTLFDYIMKNVDPKYVNFEMDVYWIKHPGQDPVALLKKYPNRFQLTHMKDRKLGTKGNQNGKTNVDFNVTLGTGDVDIAAIAKISKSAGVKYHFIEDESSRSEEQIPKSLAFLRGLK